MEQILNTEKFKKLLYCFCVLKQNSNLEKEIKSIELILYNTIDKESNKEILEERILIDIEEFIKKAKLDDNIIFYPNQILQNIPKTTRNIKFEFIPSTNRLENKIIIQDKIEIYIFK